jgi:hypothetical protein
MAIIANTFQSTSPKGNRESLSDIVSLITPRDTPIYSDIGKATMDATFDEWEIDTLNAPVANAQLEGDTFTFAAITPVVRVGNYAQILRKDWSITNTQEAVRNAGNAEKRKQIKLKRGIEIRKDVELALVSNTASVGGATRLFGGLPSWLTSNVSRGATGVNGGYNTGTKLTVAETTGTFRAFTQALMDATMQSVYQSGGNVTKAYVSPYNKSVFVTFMANPNVATYRYMAENGDNNMIVSNADIYAGPFGEVEIVPNRVMAASAAVARRVFLVDPEMLMFEWLRPIQNVPGLAVTSDSEQGVIIGEGTLKVANEAGLGVIADVFGLTAAT